MRLFNVLKSLYSHRDLILQFTRREIEMRHKASRLGHLWALITPLLMLSLYLFVFGVIFGGRFGVLPEENFLDFALALFLGISLFQVIADTIGMAPNLIVNQPNFVKKVVFPLEIISISKVIASLYFASLSIAICILLAPLSHGGLSFKVLALPLIILPLAMIALGISWTLAAIGVFVRDLDHTTTFISTAVMYASAILYSLNKVPTSIATILSYNPLVSIINEARQVVLWNHSFDSRILIYDYAISFIIMIIGYKIFQKFRPYFAEVL
jgi:lipopolysaccharide transport system permease protein